MGPKKSGQETQGATKVCMCVRGMGVSGLFQSLPSRLGDGDDLTERVLEHDDIAWDDLSVVIV